MIEQAVAERLLAFAGVSALVGTRVWPGIKPVGTPHPAIVYNRISGGPIYDDDGEAGVEQVRIQIDCWGDTYTDAKLLAVQVREALSGWFSADSLYATLETERDLTEAGSNAADYPHRTTMDFMILARS